MYGGIFGIREACVKGTLGYSLAGDIHMAFEGAEGYLLGVGFVFYKGGGERSNEVEAGDLPGVHSGKLGCQQFGSICYLENRRDMDFGTPFFRNEAGVVLPHPTPIG